LTGPLAFLPLHAAGIYGKEGPKAPDFVISSYTTTLTAILDRQNQERKEFKGVFAISQTNTPGLSFLPNTAKELDCIRVHAGKHNHKLEIVQGEEAKVDRVLEGMENYSWVHLACHAVQHSTEPTKSAICLHDERLELSKLMRHSLPAAELAFLSACQTATGDAKLPEEAVHLAAGMLLAGYRSVIATMWSIKDNDAPLIADSVYSHLFVGGNPDSTRAAEALHLAVQRLRERVGDLEFLSWVPFVHFGV
jgi:CHAT domain-containing protein